MMADQSARWSPAFHDWTSCEMYGHKFEDGRCVDCGEGDGSDDA